MSNVLHSVTLPVSTISNDAGNPEGYQTNWEYLNDQLKRLDILIQIQLLKQQTPKPAGMFDNLKGLVISEEEVNGLLQEEPVVVDESKIRTLLKDLSRLDSDIKAKRSASQSKHIYLALPHLVLLFNLSEFEEQCLIIALAPELDRKYERLYAYLQDDVTRKKPSVDLVLSLLFNTTEEKVAARVAFGAQAPLTKFLLKFTDNPEEAIPLISRYLKLDDRIVDFLLGFHDMDERLQNMTRFATASDGPDQQLLIPEDMDGFRQTTRKIFDNQTEKIGNRVVYYFYGPYGAGKKLLAGLISRDLGIPLLIADLPKILAAPAAFRESMQLLGREVILQQTALAIDDFEILIDNPDKYRQELGLFFEIIQELLPLTFLISDRPWKPGEYINGCVFIEQEFAIPPETLRKKFWENFSKL